MDGAIQRLNNGGQINLHPLDNATGFPNTYPLKSDLSGGSAIDTPLLNDCCLLNDGDSWIRAAGGENLREWKDQVRSIKRNTRELYTYHRCQSFGKNRKICYDKERKKRGNRQPLPSRTEQGTSSCLLLDFHSFPSTTCREENDMMHNLCTSQWLPKIYQWWIEVQFLPTKVLNSTKFTLDNVNPLLSLVLSVLNWLWRYSSSGNRSFRPKSFRPGYLASYFRVI